MLETRYSDEWTKIISNSYKYSFILSIEYWYNKSTEIFSNLLIGNINKTRTIKLLKLLNLLEESVKLIVHTILLMYVKNKNSEHIPNNLLIKDSSNIKL